MRPDRELFAQLWNDVETIYCLEDLAEIARFLQSRTPSPAPAKLPVRLHSQPLSTPKWDRVA